MKYIFIFLIKIYQKFISPLLPKTCKYYPTCSNYAIEAFQKYGFIKGFILAFWRILRCNPWSMGGYDPVPENFKIKYMFIRKNEKIKRRK